MASSNGDNSSLIWEVLKFLLQFNLAFLQSVFDFFRQFVYPKRKSIKNELVLITGGAGHIGQLLAIRLGKLGARVIIWDINETELPKAKQKIEKESGATVYSYVCDISKRDEVFRCAEEVKSQVGSVTMLVNNAGIIIGQNVLEISEKELKTSFGVNTFSHFYTCQAFMPDMMSNKHGHIVCVSSVASHVGLPRMGDYAAAKAATSCVMESLEKELWMMGLDNHIFLTKIQPYFILTDMFKGCKARFNVLSPILPDVAADRMVAAILSNQKIALIQRDIYAIPVLKSLLPHDCYSACDQFLGNYHFMDAFYKLDKKNE